MRRSRKDQVNPITLYYKDGIVPKSIESIAHVDGRAAQRPVDMAGVLPDWVKTLEPIDELEPSASSSLGPTGKALDASSRSIFLAKNYVWCAYSFIAA